MKNEPGMTDIQEGWANPREEAHALKSFKKINSNRKGLGADNPVEFWWPRGALVTQGRADNLSVQGW